LPCSPALAASIAAFNAKRFVCSEIPAMMSVIDFIGRKPDGLALWMNADLIFLFLRTGKMNLKI